MNQFDTPIFTGLLAHAARNPLQFHIPGHKKGAGMAPELRRFLGENVLAIDLINIAPLDDLHNPHGMIDQAQQLAAQAFGADYCFFSVQGTTGSIMTMVLAAVGPGDVILVPRNVHKSVMSAIVLAGAVPVYMQPEWDHRLGIAHGVSVETVRTALEENPAAKAVLVINPTYYGVAADLRAIVAEAHSRGVPVLVDEAHGVHIHFTDRLPVSAMAAGADLAATSVHKLGGSMTGTSVLNVREGRITIGRVAAVFSMLHTTSTSYPMLASLDVARKHLATCGRELIERTIELAQSAREQINRIPGLYCFGHEILGQSTARFDFDPTKLCISVAELGLSGAEVEQILRSEHNIEVELSDLYNILCLVTFADTEAEVERLVQALRSIAAQHYQTRAAHKVSIKLPQPAPVKLAPREAFYARTEVLPLLDCAGRVSAEFLMVYPPGIPIFSPGEVITQENIHYTLECLEHGLPVQGAEDERMECLRVVAER